MNTINHGDRAFPVHADYHEKGMTLRDYFAAQALPMAAQHMVSPGAQLNLGQYAELLAKLSYMTADAMLAERAK